MACIFEKVVQLRTLVLRPRSFGELVLQAGLQLEGDGELVSEIRVSLVSGARHLLELQQHGLELFLSCSLLDLDGGNLAPEHGIGGGLRLEPLDLRLEPLVELNPSM